MLFILFIFTTFSRCKASDSSFGNFGIPTTVVNISAYPIDIAHPQVIKRMRVVLNGMIDDL